ncbi:MAG: hypothetical protein ABIY55_29900, partial [Kofleriaceae bacterium]
MTERQLTFTDLDENPLVVRLMPDRIELAVYDSRPELAAGELRAFVSALFAEYLGPHLVIRLTAARARLLAARDAEAKPTPAAPTPARLASKPASAASKPASAAPKPASAAPNPTITALDDALRALDDIARVMTDAGAIEDPHLPPLPLTPVEHFAYAPLGGPRRTRRVRRCEEPSTLLGWN